MGQVPAFDKHYVINKDAGQADSEMKKENKEPNIEKTPASLENTYKNDTNQLAKLDSNHQESS